jgi:ferredoxin
MQTLIYFAVPIAMLLVAVVIFKRVSAANGSVGKAQTDAPPGNSNPAQASGAMRPVVDVAQCMGSGGCVRACPHQALGMVRGKAVLSSPNHCLGHGVCAAACPVGAISFIPGLPQVRAAGG